MYGVVRCMLWCVVYLLYTCFNDDKDRRTMMMQIELDSWTTRQQQTRIPTNNGERGGNSIKRKCRRGHVGYSIMGAAVSCWFMGMSTCVCVMYLCRAESV